MSRRRGRGHHHERARQPAPRPASAEPRAVGAAEHPAAPPPAPDRPVEPRPDPVRPLDAPPPAPRAEAPLPAQTEPEPVPRSAETTPSPVATATAPGAAARAGDRPPASRSNGPERNTPCTAPQLRRFIKSRPYVPMHELRRRFAIEADDDDVSPIDLDPGRVFVGLPAREGQLLGELLRAGEVGYELSLDPRTPVVIGVYPMRPVPRP